MKINTEMIINDLENKLFDLKVILIKNYENFEGSLEDFFKLDKISFDDKIFVALRFVDKNTCVKFAVKCAEHVLPIFEEKFKDDKRPRNCIDFLNSIDDFENLNHNQLELLRFHHDAAADAYRDADNYSDVFSYHYDSPISALSAHFSAASFCCAISAASSVYFASSSYYCASSASSAASFFAKSNNNTLQTQSTIFKFLLDLTN